MEQSKTFIEPLFAKAESYGKTSLRLIKLKAIDKISNLISAIVSNAILVFVLSFFVVSANIGLALWLGDILGKSYYGFFCVAGLYGLIGGIYYFIIQNKIKQSIRNSIISEMLS
jgi:hypothetical protein